MHNHTQTTVDWEAYAAKYDMLFHYNPFYQALWQEIIATTQTWEISEGDIILDMGAGTGNYSLALAEIFPQATILHIDADPGMIAMAQHKRDVRNLANLNILQRSVMDTDFDPNSLKAIVCIHALYTFPNPQQVLKNFARWLQPDGCGLFVDPGRKVNMLSWTLAIGSRMVLKHGLMKTLQIMREGKEVSRQNKRLAEMQARGELWLHSHEEFLETVSEAGFQIEYAQTCFRDISDWAEVRRR